MELVGNAMNGSYLPSLLKRAETGALREIRLAVAYVTKMDALFDLAEKRGVPLTLYALGDGDFPALPILKKFVETPRPQWRLYLSRNFYHPKIIWLCGVGAYIGSANLTDNGMMSNLECGVWFDQNDLRERDWETALNGMFDVIHKRSTAASKEHIAAFEALRAESRKLDQARDELRRKAAEKLKSIAGDDRPHDPNSGKGGGAARAAFVKEWHETLSILRKMKDIAAEYPRPAWVKSDAPLSIVQDQATEGWYRTEIRFGGDEEDGDSRSRIEEFHAKNAANPEAATRAVLKHWMETADPDRFAQWVNDNPAEIRRLLSKDSVAKLDEKTLARVLYLTHSAREHGRQMPKAALGLPPEASMTERERIDIWASVLLKSRSASGRSVPDVLQYVLWGDASEPDAAQRIWAAASSPEWKIPHLGANILGEMIGYARPDDFPPRNGRVSKTLHALGYSGIWWA